MKQFPSRPSQPHRVCWGCDRFCAAGDMLCGNGSERTPHPVELFGPEWERWSQPTEAETFPSLTPTVSPQALAR